MSGRAGISLRLSSSTWVESVWNGKGNQREQNPGKDRIEESILKLGEKSI